MTDYHATYDEHAQQLAALGEFLADRLAISSQGEEMLHHRLKTAMRLVEELRDALHLAYEED